MRCCEAVIPPALSEAISSSLGSGTGGYLLLAGLFIEFQCLVLNNSGK